VAVLHTMLETPINYVMALDTGARESSIPNREKESSQNIFDHDQPESGNQRSKQATRENHRASNETSSRLTTTSQVWTFYGSLHCNLNARTWWTKPQWCSLMPVVLKKCGAWEARSTHNFMPFGYDVGCPGAPSGSWIGRLVRPVLSAQNISHRKWKACGDVARKRKVVPSCILTVFSE